VQEKGDAFLRRRFREGKSSGSTPSAEAQTTTPAVFYMQKWLQDQLTALTPEIEKKRKGLEQAQQESLAERQRLLPPAIEKMKAAVGAPQPTAPEEKPEPTVPDTSARPFLSGEGKNALQQVVAGLGLLVTAAAGGKAPQAALGALTGAMTGWAEGDAARVTRDWQQYEGLVAKMNRENQAAQRKWERALLMRGGNIQDAELLFKTALASAGEFDYVAQIHEKGLAQVIQQLTMTENILTKLNTAQHQINQDVTNMIRAKAYASYLPEKLKVEQSRAKSYEESVKSGAAIKGKQVKITEDVAKVDQAITSARARLATQSDLRQAIDLLDREGAIPRGGTKQEILAAEAKRNFMLMNRHDIATALRIVRSWGTSMLVGRELELQMGKVAAMRFKALAEAEAGDVLSINKPFWDQALGQMEKTQRENLGTLIKERNGLAQMLQGLSQAPITTAPTTETEPTDMLKALGFEEQ